MFIEVRFNLRLRTLLSIIVVIHFDDQEEAQERVTCLLIFSKFLPLTSLYDKL